MTKDSNINHDLEAQLSDNDSEISNVDSDKADSSFKRNKKRNPPSPLLKKIPAFLSSNFYVILSFVIGVVVMIFVYYANDMTPFGTKTILRMDLYHQYGPLFAELYTRVTNGYSLIYSWCTGLGGNFLGNLFNYLSGPVSVLLFFFKEENIPEAIAFMIMIKGALASSTFCYYIKKSMGVQSFSSVAFSILYASCGYFLAYYWNIMWLDCMYLFPLILLGIERIINHKKFALYSVALALTLFSNFYMGFMACLFSVIYFIAYFLMRVPLSSVKIWPTILSRTGMFAAGSLLAGGMSAFATLPTYYALQSTSAVTGTFPENIETYFKFFDFLANHMANMEPTIRSSGEDVLPNVYCGVIVFILIPLYIFAKSISKREKIISISLLVMFYLSFNLRQLNYIWHAMHFPNDLPYRFSFMYSCVLLIMCYKALLRIKEYSGKELAISIGAAFVFVVLVEKLGTKNLTKSSPDGTSAELVILLNLIFIGLYAILILCFYSNKIREWIFTGFMLIAVFLELTISTPELYDITVTKSSYSDDKPEIQGIIDNLYSQDNDFYRLELADGRTLNDPAWHYYRGISTFSSMAYEQLAKLQNKLGLGSNDINSFVYHNQTPIYNSMFNVKYILDRNTIYDAGMYNFVDNSSQFNVYENKYNLPIGFMADYGILDWQYNDINPFSSQLDFIRKATGNHNVQLFNAPNMYTSENNVVFEGDVINTSSVFTVYDTSQQSSVTITMTIDGDQPQHLYAYARSHVINSAVISSSTITEKSVGIGNPFIIDMGIVNPGEEASITLSIYDSNNQVTPESGSLDFFAYAFDTAAYIPLYEQLAESALQVTSYSDTSILGKINVKENGIMYTSIPYDTGWKVYVDGHEQQFSAIGNSLIGIDLTAGEHEIEFKFTPKGLTIGVVISILSLLVFIAIIFIIKLGLLNKVFSRKLISSSNDHNIEDTLQVNDYYDSDPDDPMNKDSRYIDDNNISNEYIDDEELLNELDLEDFNDDNQD